ncbi:hypothetical protein AVEN_90075-1 [Araneus ventricosus]|uniref:Uncharacterized protein n=1 Tax=Araneus ventricosus TaxID=182803 RepID=A0A4Y2LRM4_ARAVE|nr:hypothetical protein AVEN_90075-1 [Araneus ventricosus]
MAILETSASKSSFAAKISIAGIKRSIVHPFIPFSGCLIGSDQTDSADQMDRLTGVYSVRIRVRYGIMYYSALLRDYFLFTYCSFHYYLVFIVVVLLTVVVATLLQTLWCHSDDYVVEYIVVDCDTDVVPFIY